MQTVKVRRSDDRVISGESATFRSLARADALAKRVCVDGKARRFEGAKGVPVFLARGSDWIDNEGRRGTNYFGKRGVLVAIEWLDD